MKVFDFNSIISFYEEQDAKICVGCDINPKVAEVLGVNEDLATELQETMDRKIAHAVHRFMDHNEEYVYNCVFSDISEQNNTLMVYLSDCKELSENTKQAIITVIEGIMDNMNLLFGFTAL